MDKPAMSRSGLPPMPSDEEFIAIFAEGLRTCLEDQRQYLAGSIGAARRWLSSAATTTRL
ncbi:MAG: hypothetical protein ACJ735_06380 [Actinomycetes bacterium]